MLKEEILNALREKGEMTSTELMEYLRDKGLEFSALEFREVLADMVRRGEVEKAVDYSRRKLLFRLPQRS
ncbi:MAG: hypothetical protein NO114_01595 [Sulfolobales archaeon]|jgi:hypothetical protein|nr:hypothetical protein [Sulfolobales archaeon]